MSCPACRHDGMNGFHHEPSVPANSNVLLDDPAAARAFPTGAITLGHCPQCGFISNVDFDDELAEYSQRYEETQGFSARFLEFATDLATHWVYRYDLTGKDVLEIGCGKGEFLVLMADAGIGSGIGIDPGVKPERIVTQHADKLTWMPRRFTAEDDDLVGDAIVCRHTLEHIPNVFGFLSGIRRAIGDRLDTVVLFELPDTQRILDEVAFWDVYYEHCAYFTQGSVARLFERCGFEILDLRLEYDGQYLIVEARPVAEGTIPRPWGHDDLERIDAAIDHFAREFDAMTSTWRSRLAALATDNKTSVAWGANSKAVSFLAVTGDHVAGAVDINPHKQGTYIAGTGHEILAPADLARLQPDLVVAMNPIYLAEIQADLDRFGVAAELVGL
ncbi:MAG TPA: class I SAM-dependent methyltransferase [Acidimicrobiia bacterium]|nr:class I SAM-dependent methyltransferase [Acidimicrobiia bacterium]